MKSVDDLLKEIHKKSAGRKTKLTVVHDAKKRIVEVTIEKRYKERKMVSLVDAFVSTEGISHRNFMLKGLSKKTVFGLF